jgi:hypothetical protein
MAVTYHVSIFDRGANGELLPMLTGKADSAQQAISGAEALSNQHAGAVAFARSERGNSVLAEFGEVLRDQLRPGLACLAGGLPPATSLTSFLR